jgi:hypothetical protein
VADLALLHRLVEPGETGEDRQPGRGAPEIRSKTAPESARNPPFDAQVLYVSYSLQASRSSTVACRSTSAWIGTSCGNGYGPGSLCDAYKKLICTRGCAPPTTAKGWPY